MKRSVPKTVKTVDAMRKSGIHPAGANLYVKIGTNGGRSWVFRFFFEGSRHNMGLGPVHMISMAEAREKIAAAQALLRAGINPLDQKHEAEPKKAPKASTVTLGEVLDLYIRKTSPEWKAGADRVWRMEAKKYFGKLLPLPVSEIGDDEVMELLQPQWLEKTVTLMRVRGKLESLLGYATASGWRQGPNPAAWKGLLEHKLAKPGKFHKVKNSEALAPAEMPGFLAKLRTVDKVVAKLAEFTILTAARGDEARLAVWGEVDLSNKVWTVPAERMKTKIEHTVPLSTAALAILEGLPRSGEVIFAGSTGQALGHAAALEEVKRVSGNPDLTLHGSRASFRTWGGDISTFPADVIKQALAHSVGDKVDDAYNKGTALEKRRVAMEAWADFLAEPVGADNVIPMRQK
jgi:integrase